jgi:hypothetical protein
MPQSWIERIFNSRIVLEGGPVRRHIKDIDKYGGGLQNLLDEAAKRRFHVIQIGDQIVVLCNPGEMRVLL